jgi:TolB protein
MKTIISLLAFSLAIAAVQAQSCNNFAPEVSPDGNTLYFSSDRDGEGYEIYRSDLDGISNLQRLTNSAGDDYDPRVSPDGSKIVFQKGAYGSSSEIYIMDSDGSNLTQLTSNSVHDGAPSFSPDGQTIIFTAWDGSPYPEIFTMNIDGSNRTQITNQGGAYWQSEGIFNPAGDKIYFLAGFNADNHIVMMDLDGTNWVDITPPNSFGYAESNVSFSPDGSKIIFYTSENQGYNNGGDLVIADADGSNWTFLTNSTNGEYYYQAVFHPTADELYYTLYVPNEGFEIYRMDTNGENAVLISNCSLLGDDEAVGPNSFNLYPNPASDAVFLRVETPYQAELLVFSPTGKLVFEQNLTAGADQITLEVSHWPVGIYLVEIRSPQSNRTQKLVISR